MLLSWEPAGGCGCAPALAAAPPPADGSGGWGAACSVQEVPVQALERAEGGGIPGGGVLDVVAWQPDLLSRACKGAQEGNKPGIGRVGGSVTGDGVVGDTKTALVVQLMEQHVNPSTVLLGPRLVCVQEPFLEEGVADLEINMLLLEAVLVRLVYLAVEVLKAGSLAKSKELEVDEAILDVVELADVIHNCLTKCWIKASVPMGTPRPM